MMLKEVENLRSDGVFEVVAGEAQASEVVKRPVQPTIVGREKIIETAWNHLMEDEVGILGMYGMGGVGKTTLLNEINNKFDTFDIVIWVVVSSNLQIQKIQEDIAKKLELAMVVATKCHGLPLALNVIGEAMASKRTIQEWHHAIDVLTSNAAEFPEVEDEILPILKFSYDNLKGECVKSDLLYCALFPEDGRINKRDLIEYWICEGIIDGSEGMERAENKGYEIIGTLIRSSLLMEEGAKRLYMHDVVREMALWIASDHFIVFAGVGLHGIPKIKNWNAVTRMSLMSNKIDHISGSLECLELTTLLLQRNYTELVNISGEFFQSMPRLVVLDLSWNRSLTELPDGISQLVSLKYLNVWGTDIECLPVGLQELKNLIHLDLENTLRLSSIVGISVLLNLKVLKLLYSRVCENPSTVEEVLVLEHLEILTIEIDYDSVLDQFLSSHKLMRCTQAMQIHGCTISEIKMDITRIRSETVTPLHNPTSACFLSLANISLWHSKCCKELTWLMFAPNLTLLSVYRADELEEIINKEKALVGMVPFQKLEVLVLDNLSDLKNIYWRPLPFPCLTKIDVSNCPKLRKLPLNSKSGSSGEKGLVITYRVREWLEGVEWEDEATKARFLPSCEKVGFPWG